MPDRTPFTLDPIRDWLTEAYLHPNEDWYTPVFDVRRRAVLLAMVALIGCRDRRSPPGAETGADAEVTSAASLAFAGAERTRREIDAGLVALKARFGPYVAEGPMIFAKAGGRRVLIVCSTGSCETAAARPLGALPAEMAVASRRRYRGYTRSHRLSMHFGTYGGDGHAQAVSRHVTVGVLLQIVSTASTHDLRPPCMLQQRKQHTVGPLRSRLVTPHSASVEHRSSWGGRATKSGSGTPASRTEDGADDAAPGEGGTAVTTSGGALLWVTLAREHDRIPRTAPVASRGSV